MPVLPAEVAFVQNWVFDTAASIGMIGRAHIMSNTNAHRPLINTRGLRFNSNGVTMEVSGWDQLVRLWELIVLVCKFLWNLLRLLGGG